MKFAFSKLILTLFGVFIVISSAAAPVEIGKARTVAEHFLRVSGNSLCSLSAKEDDGYFVFSRTSGKGFVIVAGDDRMQPVLAYSDYGSFPSGSLPDNVKYWLDGFRQEYEIVRQQKTAAPMAVSRQWDALANGSDNTGVLTADSVLMETALWNQGDPFNRKTPVRNGRHTVTGCVATAMAIVLRYYSSPVRGTGILPDYSYREGFGLITVEGYSLGYDYQWDKMLMNYNRGDFSDEEADAVATIMRDCGQMVKMNYGTDSSGAYGEDILPGLQRYMGFNGGSYLSRSRYTLDTWIEMLKADLDASRPIIYTAVSSEGGHAFVLDGYDSQDYFHINWGWGGASNGYFRCPNFDGFSQSHSAVLGMTPGAAAVSQPLRLSVSKECSGLLASTDELYVVEPFTVSFALENTSAEAVDAKLAIANFSRKESFIGLVSEAKVFSFPAATVTIGALDCKLSAVPEVGERLRLCIFDSDKGKWEPLIQAKSTKVPVEIAVSDEYSINETTKLELNVDKASLTLTLKEGVRYALVNDASEELASGVSDGVNPVVLDLSHYPAGRYVIALSKRYEKRQISIVL